jgi:hypothetical protein
MPVGIENLATGFLQGLNARKQQERQDVIDQREAERFDMQKEQFADNQAANQLAMKTNQFQLGQAQKTADRDDITWNQQQDEIKRKKDFESDLRTIFALEKEGNTEGLAKFLTEKNKTLGIKGDFERDYVTGKGALKLDKDGKAVFVHEDGTRTVYDMDDYGADFVAKFDPVTAIRNKQKTAEEIAKEDRLFKREVELVGLNAENAERLERLQKSLTPPRKEVFEGEDGIYVINAETGIPTPVVNPSTGKPLVSNKDGKQDFPDNLLSLFEKVETTTDKYGGNIKQTKVKDVEKINEFVLWANENNEPLTFSGYSKWVSSKAKKPQVDGLNAASPQSNQQKLTVNQWIKNRNITTKEQLSSAIAELRKSNPTWSNQQLKQAFVNAGVIE